MIEVEPLHPGFGARLRGIDLSRDLTPENAAEIRALIDRHGLVLLPAQGLSDAALTAMSALFGETKITGVGTNSDAFRAFKRGSYGHDSVVHRLTNIAPDGGLLPPTDKAMQLNYANQLWHTDISYARPRALHTFLQAVVVPPEGADTEYCDMRIAYETLPEAIRAQVDRLHADHWLVHSRALTGYDGWTEEERAAIPPTQRPLVYDHPESGRKVLYLASHIARIEGMTAEESGDFLAWLVEHATRPERVYTHRWHAGDLLIWDNRSTMHRATPFEDTRYARDMRSLRTLDRADAMTAAA